MLADLKRADDVLASLGNHHAQRPDLVDAGVGGIERAGDCVEADFALDLALEFVLQSRGVHQGGVGLRDWGAEADVD